MSRLLTVLFADLVGSTKLYQSLGDVEAHRQVADCLDRMRSVVESSDGTLLRTVGDAVLASFEDADAACRAAIGIQRSHVSLPLALRVGFHHGEAIADRGDVYGNAVNISARVAAYAKADEICTTEDTFQQLGSEQRLRAHFLDRVILKGIADPMPIYRVQWSDENADTEIFTSAGPTTRYATDQRLDLEVGARRFSVDQEAPSIRMGRALDCDVVVVHDSTSRHHASVELVRGHYVLRDESTNGTWVLRPGRPPDIVRREEFVLEHFGSIGLGWAPEPEDPSRIAFRLSTR